jgi:hypothetical protein
MSLHISVGRFKTGWQPKIPLVLVNAKTCFRMRYERLGNSENIVQLDLRSAEMTVDGQIETAGCFRPPPKRSTRKQKLTRAERHAKHIDTTSHPNRKSSFVNHEIAEGESVPKRAMRWRRNGASRIRPGQE